MDKKEHEKFKEQLKKFHNLQIKCLEDLLKNDGKRPLLRTSDGYCGCYQVENIGEAVRLNVYRTCTFADTNEVRSYNQDGKRYYACKCNYKSKITKALIKKFEERKNEEKN